MLSDFHLHSGASDGALAASAARPALHRGSNAHFAVDFDRVYGPAAALEGDAS